MIRANAEPLRVLYVVSLFPCWSETFIAREIAALVARGVDVRILSLKHACEALVQSDAAALLDRVLYPHSGPRRWAARVRNLVRHAAAFLPIAARSAWRLRRRPMAMLKSAEALARGLEQIDRAREFNPDLIHAHWATYPSTVAWALARALRKPFGFTCHAHDIFVDDHLLAEKISAASLAVTISRYNVEWLAAHAEPGAHARFNIVHCGVALETLPFRPAQREADLIVAVGRLDPVKGFDVLIRALAELAERGRRFRCRLIGEGPERAALAAAIARHHLGDRVELCGALRAEDVRRALYAAAVFVLPCIVCSDGNRDGIPLGLMEAMAAGTPVVSTRVSGIPELIHDGIEGRLVPSCDAVALANALASAFDDQACNGDMIRAARRKVEREFDASCEAAKLLQLFGAACHVG
jgi:glycosyltransferase involved in cell wall biosynthesis